MWEMSSGRRKRTLQHGRACVAFSPDGKTLASASRAENMKLWDLVTHEELFILEEWRGLVWGKVFAPDGRTLAGMTSGPDGTARVVLWHAAEPDAAETAGSGR